MFAIDHVIIGVDDPANAASTFRARFGLGALLADAILAARATG